MYGNVDGDDDEDDNEARNQSVPLTPTKASKASMASKASHKRVTSLRNHLQNYVEAGILTLVRWPYRDCFGSITCDLARLAAARASGNKQIVSPPKLSKHTAMMSCYARFKGTTKWMAFLDDNEFFGVDPETM